MKCFIRVLWISGVLVSVGAWGDEHPVSRPGASSVNPDISFHGLFALGAFSDPNHLQGGGHDPNVNGITLQQFKLTVGSVVDAWWRGDGNIVFLIEGGESRTELEEAYLTSLAFPWRLQMRGGQFLTRFGRLNPTHPHTWDFADQPVVNSRLLGGDGLRNPGVEVSWLTPLPFHAEVTVSVQNAFGTTASSFLNPASAAAPPENVYLGRPLVARAASAFRDLLYLGRLTSSWDVSDHLTAVAGGSALFGPNNAGWDTSTRIYGVDLYLKWTPEVTDQGWPFVTWQTEAMWRSYEAAAHTDAALTVVPAATLHDQGWYSQLVYGFMRSWTAGVRMDGVLGVNVRSAAWDQRTRVSGALTYAPSESSKVRVQYNYDKAEHNADPIHAVFVQFEFLMGVHGAHH